jgi:hypothetical protein
MDRALCIVQDDSQDLQVHCEAMSQIYSNRFCTISATGAMDGRDGCFMPCNNVKMHPCVITPQFHQRLFPGKVLILNQQ